MVSNESPACERGPPGSAAFSPSSPAAREAGEAANQAPDAAEGHVVGFGSLNRHLPEHDACSGVATLWCFLASGAQRRGLGTLLVSELERHARNHAFHKIVARTFPANRGSRRLLRNFGYRVVGVHKRDAVIDGTYTDIMVLEKLLSPGHYKLGNPGTFE